MELYHTTCSSWQNQTRHCEHELTLLKADVIIFRPETDVEAGINKSVEDDVTFSGQLFLGHFPIDKLFDVPFGG